MKNKKSAEREVFTINAFDIVDEESYDCSKTIVLYYDLDVAIDAAREVSKDYWDYENPVEVTVFGGEYQDESGDILGGPFDIYTVAAYSKEEFDRTSVGYASAYLDDYKGTW